MARRAIISPSEPSGEYMKEDIIIRINKGLTRKNILCVNKTRAEEVRAAVTISGITVKYLKFREYDENKYPLYDTISLPITDGQSRQENKIVD